MQVTQEQASPCEIELNIEVEVEKVNLAIDQTYRELGKTVNIPGFRKGKAPRMILESYLDQDKVKERAADKLLQPAYEQALKETGIEPFAVADVELVKFEPGEPLVFKAKVPLEPTVELGKYSGLKTERKVQPVTDDMISAEIEHMMDRQAEYPEVSDRPVQQEDMVVIETINDSEPNEEPKRNVVRAGSNLPDFDNGLMGMNVGEEKVIEVTYPEDYGAEDLRGKTVPLRTKIIELREKKMPELTDEWVKENFAPKAEGENASAEEIVDTVDKLRARIRSAMEKAANDTADVEVQNKLVDQITESSNVCFPNVMVNDNVRERFEELMGELKKRQVTFDDYLKHIGKTFEELRGEYEEDAKRMLKTSLVLREITEKEDMSVSDDEVKAELQSMAAERGVPVETIEAYVDKTEGTNVIKNRILHKKLMDFIVQASNIKNVGQ